jgi:hypothetical protein
MRRTPTCPASSSNPSVASTLTARNSRSSTRPTCGACSAAAWTRRSARRSAARRTFGSRRSPRTLDHRPDVRSTPRTDQPLASRAAAIAAPTRPEVPVTAATRVGDGSSGRSSTGHSDGSATEPSTPARRTAVQQVSAFGCIRTRTSERLHDRLHAARTGSEPASGTPAGEHPRVVPAFTNIATRDAGRTPSDAGHARVNPEASIIR